MFSTIIDGIDLKDFDKKEWGSLAEYCTLNIYRECSMRYLAKAVACRMK